MNNKKTRELLTKMDEGILKLKNLKTRFDNMFPSLNIGAVLTLPAETLWEIRHDFLIDFEIIIEGAESTRKTISDNKASL